MAEGWIKLHKKMLDWEWYNDTSTKILWLHILLKVNWKPGRFQGREVPAGSFVTSTRRLAEELGISRSTVEKSLNKLKMTGEIETLATPRYTLISVRSWTMYQNEAGHWRDTNDDTSETQDGTQGGHNRRNKEHKNIRKKEKEYTPVLSNGPEEEELFGYESGD